MSKYNIKAYLIQIIISLVLILLSLIGLLFGVWETLACVSCSIVFAFIYLFLIISGSKYVSANSESKGVGKFLLSTLLRFIVAALGIFISALIIKITDDGNKWRYLNVVAATLPFLCVNLTLSFVKDGLAKDGE